MKRFLVALMLLLPIALGATAYGQNTLKVASNLNVEEHQRLSLTTGGAITTYVSYLTIELENTASTPALNVTVLQDLSSVEGILNYSPSAYLSAPRTPVWNLGTMAPGKKIVVSATLSGKRTQSLLFALSQPEVKFGVPAIKLTAPLEVELGGKYPITATYGGKPLLEVEIEVTSPEGTKSILVTDESGEAEFSATSSGYYTYLVRGYPQEKYISTKASEPKPKEPVPSTAAAAVDSGGLPIKLENVLPLILGLIVVAAVIFVLMSYLSGRREEEQPPVQSDSPYYSYSYAQQPSQEGQQPAKQVDAQATRDLLASRRADQEQPAALEGEKKQAEDEETQSQFNEMGEQTSVYSDEVADEGKDASEGGKQAALEGGEYTRAFPDSEESELESAIDEELSKSEEEGEAPEPKSAEAEEKPEEESNWEEEQSSIQRQLELIRAKLAKSRQIDKAEKELEEAATSLPDEEEEPATSGKFAVEEEEEAGKGDTPIEEAELEAQEESESPEEKEAPKPSRVSRPLARYTSTKLSASKGRQPEKTVRKAPDRLKAAGKKRR
jgi:hypothetical protein